MWTATQSYLSVYIHGPISVEVFYIAFPRFSSGLCCYATLERYQREEIYNALKTAQEIADRFNADGRFDATAEEIKKAFNRA